MTTAAREALDPGFLSRLPDSADGYAQKIELARELVLCIAMDEAAYRTASFLDDRILGPATRGAWFSLSRVLEASQFPRSPRPLRFIFHTGHVGSTLLSRLLDATGKVLPVREPLPLRTLATAFDRLQSSSPPLSAEKFDVWLDLLLRLWSRGYPGTEQVVVKATSSAGSLAMPLLTRVPEARAIYLNVRAETYLATLLAGANSSQDLLGHGPARIERLQARTAAPIEPLSALSPGELAAMSWLVETLSQRAAMMQLSKQVLAVDFDALLADVPATLEAVLGHFDLAVEAAWFAGIEKSGVLGRYSKAPELVFTPTVRREVLDAARYEHAVEIRKGLAWLERMARSDTTLAAAF